MSYLEKSINIESRTHFARTHFRPSESEKKDEIEVEEQHVELSESKLEDDDIVELSSNEADQLQEKDVEIDEHR